MDQQVVLPVVNLPVIPMVPAPAPAPVEPAMAPAPMPVAAPPAAPIISQQELAQTKKFISDILYFVGGYIPVCDTKKLTVRRAPANNRRRCRHATA